MRVLLLVDGQHTEELLASLAKLVRLNDSELLLVYALGPEARASLDMFTHRPGYQDISPGRSQEASQAEQERARAALADAERLATPLAAAIDSIQKVGEAARAVCDAAAALQADLVALRARGRDQPPGGPFALGPTARYIADHAQCPVLLLHSD
jgi:nucleotide-binding universal stress UspA family protein